MTREDGFIYKGDLEEINRELVSAEEQEKLLELANIINISSANREKILKLLRIYIESSPKHKLFLETQLYDQREAEFIGRIREYKIGIMNTKFGQTPYFDLVLENGMRAILVKLKQGGLQEFLKESYGNLIHAKLALDKSGKYAYIEDYNIYKIREDVETARRLLNKYKPWELFLEGVGVKATITTLRLYLPRILSLFKVSADPRFNSAIHVIQLTPPGMGKTTFYSILKHTFNIEVFTTFPSSARLILDARNNRLGAVFTRDIIVIDAFDKNLNKTEFTEFYSKVETGLSNGIWTREKASALRPEERKDTGFVFLGNLNDRLLAEVNSARDYVEALFEKEEIDSGTSHSFLDRIAIVDVHKEFVHIYDYLTHRWLRANVIRALWRIILRNAFSYPPDISAFEDLKKGRLQIHAQRIAKLCYALELPVESVEQFAKALVLGETKKWEAMLRETKEAEEKEEEPKQQEEAKEEEHEGYEFMKLFSKND